MASYGPLELFDIFFVTLDVTYKMYGHGENQRTVPKI